MRSLNRQRAVILHDMEKDPEDEEEAEFKSNLKEMAMDCKYSVNGLASILLQGKFYFTFYNIQKNGTKQ